MFTIISNVLKSYIIADTFCDTMTNLYTKMATNLLLCEVVLVK